MFLILQQLALKLCIQMRHLILIKDVSIIGLVTIQFRRIDIQQIWFVTDNHTWRVHQNQDAAILSLSNGCQSMSGLYRQLNVDNQLSPTYLTKWIYDQVVNSINFIRAFTAGLHSTCLSKFASAHKCGAHENQNMTLSVSSFSLQ